MVHTLDVIMIPGGCNFEKSFRGVDSGVLFEGVENPYPRTLLFWGVDLKHLVEFYMGCN